MQQLISIPPPPCLFSVLCYLTRFSKCEDYLEKHTLCGQEPHVGNNLTGLVLYFSDTFLRGIEGCLHKNCASNSSFLGVLRVPFRPVNLQGHLPASQSERTGHGTHTNTHAPRSLPDENLLVYPYWA